MFLVVSIVTLLSSCNENKVIEESSLQKNFTIQHFNSNDLSSQNGFYISGPTTIDEDKFVDDPNIERKPSEGLSYRIAETDDAYLVSGIGECEDKDIVIPKTHNDLPVVGIYEGAFSFRYGQQEITSMIIPDGVTEIGASAFKKCTITSIVIPNSVVKIGVDAFSGCALTDITIPSSVVEIGGNDEIGDSNVFWECNNLTRISVDKDNKIYHSDGNCLIETKSKTLISGCKSSIIPSDGTVTKIGECAFVGSAPENITIPSGVTEIGKGAFGYYNYTIKSIIIPDSVKYIGAGAFARNHALESIKIPNGVTKIEENTFYDCFHLTSIVIPNSVTEFYDNAFTLGQ